MDIRPYSKAIAGVVSFIIVTLLAKYHIVLTPDMTDNVNIIIGAVIVALGVFVAPKNQPTNLG